MIQLLLCEHRLELLTRAVKAYQPTADEETEHKDLVEYLASRAELGPEDIPF